MGNVESKAWYASKGVVGGVVAVLSVVAGAFGYNLSPEDQEAIVVSIAAIGSAVGGLLAIYGRLHANRKIG